MYLFRIFPAIVVLTLATTASILERPVFAQDQKSEDTKESKTSAPQLDDADKDQMFELVKAEKLDEFKKLVESKTTDTISATDVLSVKTEYGATLLHYACDRGNLEIAKYLIDGKVDINAKDTFYNSSPIDWAFSNGHSDVIELLIKSGSSGHNNALSHSISQKRLSLLKAVLETKKCSDAAILAALKNAKNAKLNEFVKLLQAVEVKEASKPKEIKFEKGELEKYVGKFSSDREQDFEFVLEEGKLKLVFSEENKLELTPKSKTNFTFSTAELAFKIKDNKANTATWTAGGNTLNLTRKGIKSETKVTKPADPAPVATKFPASSEASRKADRAIASKNWAQFRGNGARGIADGQTPPMQWKVTAKGEDENLLWKQDIPGLGHSCPVIWDNKLFITTAHSEKGNDDIRTGLYGDVDSVEDDSIHQFKIYCLDKSTGKILWEKIAVERKPSVKRHLKSTHANPTCATNGKYVIAFFASEGLYCYTTSGEFVWKKDLGRLDSGWFFDSGYEWGFASSPVIHKNRLVIQCDIQKDSYIAALDLETGAPIWKTKRDEIPTWSTPTIHDTGDMQMVITNGTKAARAYDLENGQELWSVSGNSEIAVPTPMVAHGIAYVTSGYRPIQPIWAVKLSARGKLVPQKKSSAVKKKASGEEAADKKEGQKDGDASSVETLAQDTNPFAWYRSKGGPYMPTPVIYGDYLYLIGNSGVLACHQAKTGERVYRKRVGNRASFTGSPIAADGHLYFTSEEGKTFVVKAGPEFELVSTNEIDQAVLSTPAISESVFYIRAQNSIFALKDGATAQSGSDDPAKTAEEKDVEPKDDSKEKDENQDK